MASALATKTGSYKTLHTIADVATTPDTDLAAATGYFLAAGPMSDAVDLVDNDGVAGKTEANAVQLIMHATDATDGDTLTQSIYGQADSGPPQLIASIVWTIGLAQVSATATELWADTAVVTSTHLKPVTVSDGAGGDSIASVSFDVTGFRYLKAFVTAETGDPVIITTLYRHW